MVMSQLNRGDNIQNRKGRDLQSGRKGPGTRTEGHNYVLVLTLYSEGFQIPFVSMNLGREATLYVNGAVY